MTRGIANDGFQACFFEKVRNMSSQRRFQDNGLEQFWAIVCHHAGKYVRWYARLELATGHVDDIFFRICGRRTESAGHAGALGDRGQDVPQRTGQAGRSGAFRGGHRDLLNGWIFRSGSS